MSIASTAGLAGLFAMMNRPATDAAAAGSAVIVSGAPTATANNQLTVRVPSPASPVAPEAGTQSSTNTQSPASPASTQSPKSIDLVIPNQATPAAATEPAPTQPTVVDGAVSRTRWGNVQVEATFAPDGTLTDIVALEYPNDRGTSRRISDYAIPRLTSEALTIQTAEVHTITGATYTSNGYRQSLQSAIDAARAAGVTSIA